MATEKTLGSKLFFETLNQNRIDDIHIHEQIGYELVNLIEEDSHSKQNLQKILEKYLVPMINKNIDCLLLGCTHYNHIKDVIEEIIPVDIKIVDTIAPVNNRVLNILKSNNILNKSTNKRTIKIFYNGKKLSRNYLDQEYDLRYLEF